MSLHGTVFCEPWTNTYELKIIRHVHDFWNTADIASLMGSNSEYRRKKNER